MQFRTILIFIALLLTVINVSANIGIGISPAKITDTIESGQEKEYTYTLYNTGDLNVTARLETDNLENIVKFEPEEIFLEPEPLPHRLPPVNGKQVKAIIKGPKVTSAKNISGNIVALVNPGFGGFITTGAVASKVILQVSPSKGIFASMTAKQKKGTAVVGVLAILIIINLFYIHKKYIRKQ